MTRWQLALGTAFDVRPGEGEALSLLVHVRVASPVLVRVSALGLGLEPPSMPSNVRLPGASEICGWAALVTVSNRLMDTGLLEAAGSETVIVAG